MIAELLTTIIMALGVATGNVSSNSYKSGNAFNNVEKATKNKQNAPQPINNTYYYHNTQTISANINNITNKKYVLTEYNQQNETSMISNNYYNINNSTYFIATTHGQQDGSVTIEYLLLGIYKITPYWNTTNVALTIHQRYRIGNINSTNSNWVVEYDIYTMQGNADNLIDLTLTNGIVNDIYNFYHNNEDKEDRAVDRLFPGSSLVLQNDNFDIQHTIQPLQETTAKTLIIGARITQNNFDYTNDFGYIEPVTLGIETNALIPDINYEIVDIPNLIYTILTMPFSFISTAFNLTVFPGTPYALNFGNLFLTILAVFILLWLIQKVFK